MNWQAKDLSEEFKLFKQRVMLCIQDSNITQRDKQAIKIKIAVGTEGLRRLNASGLSEQDQSDSDKLWSIFEDQLKINVNFRIHRLELMRFRQKQTETLDEFTNRCRDKASHCLFSLEELNERVVVLVIASTPLDSFRHSLLEKPSGYKITEMLEEGRRHEAVAASMHCLQHVVTAPYLTNRANALPILIRAKHAAVRVTGRDFAEKLELEDAHQVDRLAGAADVRTAHQISLRAVTVAQTAVVPRVAISSFPTRRLY